MGSTVGLPVPKLLPIAGTWAAPFTLYFLLLSGRIVAQRLKTEVFIGHTSNFTAKDAANPAYKPKPDPLHVAIRCHSNFLDTVPLAFIFLTTAELNGGNRKALNYVMASLLALRIAQAEGGLRLQGKFGNNGIGRPVGYFGSMGVLGGLAGYAAFLAKGYWGL
ncbi:membrane-associated, eicosanoid/glutathione metabolism protein [Hyaloscypha sp. PMI_1271]|nr:membrane-associated, eicosanoid/glutathione metabolism protein [Hyaloscypha sp. PMI_1271]